MNVTRFNGLIPPCLERPLSLADKPLEATKYIVSLFTIIEPGGGIDLDELLEDL